MQKSHLDPRCLGPNRGVCGLPARHALLGGVPHRAGPRSKGGARRPVRGRAMRKEKAAFGAHLGGILASGPSKTGFELRDEPGVACFSHSLSARPSVENRVRYAEMQPQATSSLVDDRMRRSGNQPLRHALPSPPQNG
ncbi:hypothetical protein LZ32DRAFT_30855 [Colletotrichum eremochloae]|nr:hypothetical protein LZ32DRAFT_30855 [Colletotrichum eremochloae]